MAKNDQNCLKKLKAMREEANWEIEEDRYALLKSFAILANRWKGQLPNLRDIFRSEEMNWLLAENVKSKCICNNIYNCTKLVKFAIKAGYKDRPELDEDGKPILRRANALHCAARLRYPDTVADLFKIYTSYDANYSDDRGLTHFHVACEFGHADVVKKFLEHGLNPDCSSQETKAGWVDPPIHLAVAHDHKKIVQLLLKHGAQPFQKDADGWTPVHVICERIRQEKRASDLRKYF